MNETMILGFFVGLFFLCAFMLVKSFYLVRQAEVVLIERFGRFNRTLDAGIHLVTPFIEQQRGSFWTFLIPHENGGYIRMNRVINRIDMREAVYDFPKQNVITKDNVTMEINALLYYQITDPKAAVYEVSNLPEAIEKLTQTTLRNVIGSLDLDESLVSRDKINEKLRLILDEATDKWGVKINRVELQEVNPPRDIREAMEKQMRAERERRKMIIEAEGEKRSAILKAEGRKEAEVLEAEGEAQALILHAEGEAQARLKIVEAEAKAIQMVAASTASDPLPYLLGVAYIKSLPELTKGKNDKLVVVPYEAAGLVGSLASMKKIFETVGS